MVQDQKPNSSLSGKVIASVATAILAVGGFAAWYAYGNFQKQDQVNNPPKQHQNQNPTNNQTDKQQEVAIYLLNNDLEVIPHQILVQQEDNPEDTLVGAFDYLLADNQQSSAIPNGTSLIDISLKEDGIYVNLSSEFTEGGGSASMIGRLGQIVYTATSLDNDASVWINVDGESLEVLGGEGIIIEQPMTREIFSESF